MTAPTSNHSPWMHGSENVKGQICKDQKAQISEAELSGC